MSKPVSRLVSQVAVEYVLSDRPPTYAELDCYKFVRQCVRDCGGDMKYAGSNDVFRNGCTEVMPLSDAIAFDKLKTGWALFIVEAVSGSTPEKYRGDGKGDASHMGLYTDLTNTLTGERVEVAHSSATRGQVAASTLKNAWNWAGKLKDVDYGDGAEQGAAGTDAGTLPDAPLAKDAAVVLVDGLRLRKSPDASTKTNVIASLKAGDLLTGIQTGYKDRAGNPWAYGHTTGEPPHKGYAMLRDLASGKEYLRMNTEEVAAPAPEEPVASGGSDAILREIREVRDSLRAQDARLGALEAMLHDLG